VLLGVIPDKLLALADVAWVHGIETSQRCSKTGEVSSSRNYGTNIFINHDGRWSMVFHQSAIIPQHG
jgi:hypothetical protein